jgi:signal transduction histidine kinase
MQKEFINIAAHELRTPIQPILGLSEVLQSKEKDEEKRTLINVISRNARRLHRLTEDILDVTRIASQLLRLSKEKFDLNDLVLSIVEEYKKRNMISMVINFLVRLYRIKTLLVSDISNSTPLDQ